MKRFIYGLLTCCIGLGACQKHSHNHEHTENEEKTTCKDHHHGIEMSPEEAQIAGVEVITVKRGPFQNTLEVSGKIEFAQNDEIVVPATTAGIIQFTHTFTDGTAVKQGSLLCHISRDNMAGGDPIKKEEISYKIAQEELERMKRLVKEQIVTQTEYNAALERFENSRIAYEATLESKTAKGHTVKAPISGFVLETLVSNGTYVEAGTPLIRLVRNRKMMLTADVPLHHQKFIHQVTGASFITEGNTTVFNTDSLHANPLVYPSGVSASSAFLTLRWEMDRKPEIWSGSYAKIFLHTNIIPDAITIPVSALTDEAGTFYAYLRHGKDHYIKQRVQIGGGDGQRVQVLKGIEEGDQVVVTGAMCVRQAGMSKVLGGHGHSH